MVRSGRVLTRGVRLGLVRFEFSLRRIAMLTVTGLVSMHGVRSVRSISFVERGCVVGLGWEFGFPLAVNTYVMARASAVSPRVFPSGCAS